MNFLTRCRDSSHLGVGLSTHIIPTTTYIVFDGIFGFPERAAWFAVITLLNVLMSISPRHLRYHFLSSAALGALFISLRLTEFYETFSFFLCLGFLIFGLPGCFSLCEAIVLARGLSFAVNRVVAAAPLYSALNSLAALLQHPDHVSIAAVLIALVVFASAMVAPAPLSRSARRLGFLALLVLIACFGVYSLLFVSQQTQRMFLCAAWAALLGCSMLVVVLAQRQHWPRIITRKVFHFFAAVAFTVGYATHWELTRLASCAALCVYLLTELARLAELGRMSKAVDAFLRPLADERDGGIVITAHLHLLLALAAPGWLTAVFSPTHMSVTPAACYAGAIAAGLGDAVVWRLSSSMGCVFIKVSVRVVCLSVCVSVCVCAAAVGVRFGRVRWPFYIAQWRDRCGAGLSLCSRRC